MANNIKAVKAKKADENRRNDIRLYRLMVEFVLAIIAVTAGVMLGNVNDAVMELRLHNAMLVVVMVTGILFAASAVFFVMGKKKMTDNAYKIFTRAGIFGNLAVLFFGSLHYYLFYDAESLIVALIAVTVVYFTYNIFDGGLVDYSVITATGFLALGFAAFEGRDLSDLALLIVHASKLLAVVLPVAAVIYVLVKNSKNKNSATVPTIVSSVITLAGGILNYIYPAFAVYAVFVLAGVYLVVVIAHAVKSM